jgi:imidazolonepropionase
MNNIGEIHNGAILFGDRIEWVGTAEDARKMLINEAFIPEVTIDARNKTVLPGFVDSHTHIIFAGDRSEEFASRLRGATYKQIAEAGGGILKTVDATRQAKVADLTNNGCKIARKALLHGTTAIEIKSGYGLTTNSELKMLESIAELKKKLPANVSTTFLGAHDFPPEYKDDRDAYVDLICNEMIPAVAEAGLAEFCDAFIDEGYYTIEQGRKILETGMKHGLKPKAHCDELADVDAAALAIELEAASADHLLFVSDKNIEGFSKSETVATLLPGTAYFIRMPYAPARKLIDRGAIVALATDCNPGSCFTENMQMILSLAVINMKMTAEEALTAATLNGAFALGLSSDMGSLEVGKLANLIIADVPSYTHLFYHFGVNHVESVYIGGMNITNNLK